MCVLSSGVCWEYPSHHHTHVIPITTLRCPQTELCDLLKSAFQMRPNTNKIFFFLLRRVTNVLKFSPAYAKFD